MWWKIAKANRTALFPFFALKNEDYENYGSTVDTICAAKKGTNLENLRTNILQHDSVKVSPSRCIWTCLSIWAFEFERCPIGNGGPGFGNGQTGGVADVASAVAASAALQATWTEKKQKNIVTHDEKQTTG